MACFGRWISIAKNYKSLLIVLLVPVLISPLLQESWHQISEIDCDPTCETGCIPVEGEVDKFYRVEEKRPYKCLFALIILATYWTAEVTPLAVTSLIPMFLFPTLGLLPAARTAQHYFKDTNFLFFGGLIVAIAIEECNLHLRIALTVMKAAGSKLHSLMAAFMAVTAFLSMWISNTATTAMMLPIAVATVKTIVGEDVETNENEENSVSSQPEADQEDQEPRVSRSKSILTLNLYKFGGFIQSRFGSRAPSRMQSPMASQNLDMINSQLLNRDSQTVNQPIKSRQSRPKV